MRDALHWILFAAVVSAGATAQSFQYPRRAVVAREWRVSVERHLEKCHPEPRVMSRADLPTRAQRLREEADEIEACGRTTGELKKLVSESREP